MTEGSRRFLVTTAPGLQGLLAEELRSLGIEPTLEASGAVTFTGDWAAASRVLVRTRIGSRLLLSLRRFSARTKAMLYDQVRRIDWPAVFPSTLTMAVEAAGSLEGTDYVLSYAPLRIKDAVCDEFRKRGFLRPDVDRWEPDVSLHAFFHRGRCELSVDLSGRPLHRRGYRQEGAEAPLRENRAAALLLFCGYDGSRPFLDPFCGSGTIPIEAALIATRTAPGLLRVPDAFTLGRLFPEAADALGEEHHRAREERRESPPHPIAGSDSSGEVLEIARGNAGKAGVGEWVRFEERDARRIEAPDSWIVTNPPYGERLEDPVAAQDLIRAFVHGVKHACAGSCLGLVVPRGALEKAVGLRPQGRLAVESGPLGLRYLCYEIQAGRFTPAPPKKKGGGS
jgi:23S rRNA G2445 N2-methylase RlmL